MKVPSGLFKQVIGVKRFPFLMGLGYLPKELLSHLGLAFSKLSTAGFEDVLNMLLGSGAVEAKMLQAPLGYGTGIIDLKIRWIEYFRNPLQIGLAHNHTRDD